MSYYRDCDKCGAWCDDEELSGPFPWREMEDGKEIRRAGSLCSVCEDEVRKNATIKECRGCKEEMDVYCIFHGQTALENKTGYYAPK